MDTDTVYVTDQNHRVSHYSSSVLVSGRDSLILCVAVTKNIYVTLITVVLLCTK